MEFESQGWIKWVSISTSALTLSFHNIDHYVTARTEEKKAQSKKEEFEGTFKFKMQYSKSPHKLNFKSEEKYLVNLSTDKFEDVFSKGSIELISKGLTSMKSASFELKSLDTFGPMSILKNISVFLPATLFKVMAVSIIGVFFKLWAFFVIIPGYMIVMFFCLGITAWCHKLRYSCWKMCCFLTGWGLLLSLGRSLLESFFLSWLTITNLGRGKADALFRLVSTIYWTIAHTITFTVILAICNTDPGIITMINGSGDYYKWTWLGLVQDLTILNETFFNCQQTPENVNFFFTIF